MPEDKVHKGGQLPYCRHMDIATLKVLRSQKSPFRSYFAGIRKEMCRFFKWADELPVDQGSSQVYCPKENLSPLEGMLGKYIPRPKLQRQFAVSEN